MKFDLNKQITPILALLVITFGFAYFGVCLLSEKKADPQVSIAIVGIITTVLGYFFGSSKGSAKKDEVIANGITQPTVAQTADTITNA